MIFEKFCITTRTKKNQYTLCTVFSFCLHNGRGSNKAAAHSAASNQPSGLLLRVTGCGSQHPPRALGGTCVLLAAAPTTPPCIGHRPQSSLLQVPMVRNVYRGSCGSKDFMAFLFCKPWVHGFCTVFARSVLSMSDDVGRCIALQSVPFFASGEQCQAQLCLHFRVGILEQFQKSRHGDGGFATDLLRDFLRREALLVELPKIRRESST